MKKTAAFFITVFISTLFLFGCSKDSIPTDETNHDETAGAKIKVMASFYPMYDFAVQIGGDKVSVENMVPAGMEPHDWEPAASDIAALEKADVFIYNGAGMEHWVDTVFDSLDNKELVKVEASKGIPLLEGHGHSHDEEGNGDADSAVEDDHEEDADHDEEQFDPHVWLSPANAKIQIQNIRDAFIKADPDNEAYYNKNYEIYAAKLDGLDQKYKDTLSGLEHKDIIVAHEAFAYLCNSYGLNQIGIEGLSPDSEPDPARMEEIIEFAKDKYIKIIFFEELVSPKVAEIIAEEIGAETKVLNPLEGLTEEQIKAGADYISVMEDNLNNLLEALQ